MLIKNKKGIGFNPMYLVVIAIILILYFGFAGTADILGCNLGTWSINSWDSNSKTFIIDNSFSDRVATGCFGSPNGIISGASKEDCIVFFEGVGQWNQEFKECKYIPTGYLGSISNKFLDNKEISYSGTCSLTCTDGRGCGGIGLGAYQSINYDYKDVGFDGAKIFFGATYNAWVKESCNGKIIIKPESSFPTGSVVEDDEIIIGLNDGQYLAPPPPKLNIFQRINLAIDNFFDWLFRRNK